MTTIGTQRRRLGWLTAALLGASTGIMAAVPSGAGLTPVAPTASVVAMPDSAPRIEVAEPIHDFGRLPAGEQRKHEFLVKNVGTAPLEISQVRTSCGCTTMGEWDRQIEPGSTGKIPVQFDTRNYSGTLQRTVILVTNDPRQRQAVLQVKAEIWVPFEVTPRTVMFQYESDATEGETKAVRIVSRMDEPLEFTEVQSGHSSFEATLKTVEPGREFTLEIRTVPPVGTGMVTAPVVLRPSDTNLAPIQVVAYAVERQPLTISPASLAVPLVSARAVGRPSVMIRNNTGHLLELSNPEINVPDATVQLTELQPNRVFRLTLEFPDDFEFPLGQRIELTVQSNHPRHPEIRVPVLPSHQAVRMPTPTPTPTVTARTNTPPPRPVSRPAAALPPPPPVPIGQ